MQKKLLVLSSLLFSILFCTAQNASSNVISTQGGYAKTNDISLEWTLGETVATTSSLPGYIYTQGFNQSFIIVGKRGSITSTDWVTVLAAPNPVTSNLIIAIDLITPGKYVVEITNLSGIKVFQKLANLNSQKLSIDMRRYTNGVYLLQVYNADNKLVNTTKIIKL
jgi:hypothetical protein